jgi:type II secretion system protein G
MPCRLPHPPRAFTLIELLIVVAIIAILAAIAVPNFLEAQTRSKVSRVKADLRSLATAMEAYSVDFNKYPTPSDLQGHFMPNPASAITVNPMETRVPVLLTTPIAYISSRPEDPFARTRPNESRLYHTVTWDYLQLRRNVGATVNWTLTWNRFFREIVGENPPANVQYFMLSWGPDQEHSAHVPHITSSGAPHTHGAGALYNPTNGTVSNGDILYFGPGRGFWYQD